MRDLGSSSRRGCGGLGLFRLRTRVGTTFTRSCSDCWMAGTSQDITRPLAGFSRPLFTLENSMLRALWLSLLVLVAVPAAAQEYRSKDLAEAGGADRKELLDREPANQRPPAAT